MPEVPGVINTKILRMLLKDSPHCPELPTKRPLIDLNAPQPPMPKKQHCNDKGKEIVQGSSPQKHTSLPLDPLPLVIRPPNEPFSPLPEQSTNLLLAPDSNPASPTTSTYHPSPPHFSLPTSPHVDDPHSLGAVPSAQPQTDADETSTTQPSTD
ncbi:merozoite surface protein CMZ-8-like [Benincasa hispida]|uniref:merozoite surface protein CMZ-8-like n=1 Tax=Benincasa hispida TaxID=102211 RepID=UPI0018FFC2FE|nr:merozoite surface protein CMZ-8-like [Benincasa hispida]